MWEAIDDITSRMKVPGGWIVKSRMFHVEGGVAVHQIFIADPDHEWALDKNDDKYAIKG